MNEALGKRGKKTTTEWKGKGELSVADELGELIYY